jgi:TatD DNase family protein
VAPHPYRGKRNEPAFVIEVVKRLAELKGVALVDMALQIEKTATRVFGV